MPKNTHVKNSGKGSHPYKQNSVNRGEGKGSVGKEGGSWSGTSLPGGSKAKGACLPKALVLLLPFMTVITLILVKM